MQIIIIILQLIYYNYFYSGLIAGYTDHPATEKVVKQRIILIGDSSIPKSTLIYGYVKIMNNFFS